MRILLIKNNRIKDVYNFNSVENLEEALGLQGGEYVVSEQGELGDSWPMNDDSLLSPQSAPQPLTIDQVRIQLDSLREQAQRKYISTWGETSRRYMWEPLSDDLRDVAGLASSEIIPEKFPNLVGFLKGSVSKLSEPYPEAVEGETEPEAIERLETQQAMIFAAAQSLSSYQQEHIAFVRRCEIIRAALISKYQSLSELEKSAWNSKAEWEAAYGA